MQIRIIEVLLYIVTILINPFAAIKAFINQYILTEAVVINSCLT